MIPAVWQRALNVYTWHDCCTHGVIYLAFLATYNGWPVSTTHTIIGAVVGFGLMEAGLQHIRWNILAQIALSWVLTPFFSGLISFIFFEFIRRRIFDSSKPEKKALLFMPIFTTITVFIFLSVTLFQGLKVINLNLAQTTRTQILMATAVVTYCISFFWIYRKVS